MVLGPIFPSETLRPTERSASRESSRAVPLSAEPSRKIDAVGVTSLLPGVMCSALLKPCRDEGGHGRGVYGTARVLTACSPPLYLPLQQSFRALLAGVPAFADVDHPYRYVPSVLAWTSVECPRSR